MRANYPKNAGTQNMAAVLQQAQKMQEEMAAKEEELAGREYEISAGGGAVKLKINGKREVLSLELAPEIVDPDDVETLSDVLVAAVNEAIKRVDSEHESEMAGVTGALGMPGGMPGMPGGIPGLF